MLAQSIPMLLLFNCNYQDDVAGVHWRSTSITIFTTMLWFRDNSSKPMAIASDNKDHNASNVVPYSYRLKVL